MIGGASFCRQPSGIGMEPGMNAGLHAWGHLGSRIHPDDMAGKLEIRMTDDAAGAWMEVGFVSPEKLDGSAATGWRQGNMALWLERSTDLRLWACGHFRDCAGSPEKVTGGWEYWSRAAVPRLFYSVLCDLTATTDRYGKSITAITAQGAAVSLPNFPYAMPAAAATLQADLRAAGFSGATVSSVSGSLVARGRNHTVNGAFVISFTMSGASVVAATCQGISISLPGFPYSMPSAAATLQTDLRAAGYSGAVVNLHGDTWTVLLPDRSAGGNDRDFFLTITPGNPYPVWDFNGNYVGLAAADGVVGTSGNVRAPDGRPLAEAAAQFARLGFRHLT